ncbi:MAG TPA: thermonuclease family protein [Acidimicrobiales bacterium]|jgi:micrococcal nuclease|nr:thermonuclease family protein [Acidimicrobiales bacterium]
MVRGSPLRHLVVAAAALVAAALVVAGCGRSASGPAAQASGTSPGRGAPLPAGFDTTVERVVDGDTLVVAGGHRVRLIGVDTPETKDPRKPVQCFGQEASAYVSSLLKKGEGVRLVGDAEERDVYGRILAYVYRLADGLFVNAALVREGYAQALTIPPNVAHADEFVALARDARQGGRGLWSTCPAVKPP